MKSFSRDIEVPARTAAAFGVTAVYNIPLTADLDKIDIDLTGVMNVTGAGASIVGDGIPELIRSVDLVADGNIVINSVPFSQLVNGNICYKMVSSGKGRTTCSYFLPDGKHIIYASTFKGADTCPPVPDRAKYGNKYIWPLYDSYDIFMADIKGKIVKQLTTAKGYDAEGTLSPDGKKMIYCSDKNGDLDLYIMDLATGKEKRVTNTLGYDGGAWFSPDGKKIVWRASRPSTDAEIKEYKELLAQGLVAPTHMEVYVADADGKNAKQITFLDQANWAPNFTPDGKHIIFCSNHEYKRGFPFNMYLTDLNGKGLEKISRDKGFDAFPMFSPDGKKILFSSNRNNGGTRDTNLFMADWVE